MAAAADAPPWVTDLAAQAMVADWTTQGHCWIRSKGVSLLRYPTNDTGPVGEGERRDLLWRRRAAVLQYHEPAGELPANASLYLCTDHTYSLASLSANNRSKVRRGLRAHQVRPVTAEEVIASGYASYRDTRQRHGGPMMSAAQFTANWQRQRHVANREIWAAWADGEIAAFGTVHRCGRWASISATVSHRRHQRTYVNHALFFSMLKHLMAEPDIESVSYGLSSLRPETARGSLHHFKTSVGLVAVPVHRHVVVHPLLRPVVNRGGLAAARLAERRAPAARVPRAARAVIEFLLSKDGPAEAAEVAAVELPVGGPSSGGVRPAHCSELDAVADLHRSVFPHYESSRLGPAFCRRLIGAYAAHPDAVVLVIGATGAPTGYLVACPPAVQRAVTGSLAALAVRAVATRALRSPRELVTGLATGWCRARRVMALRLRSRRPDSAASGPAPPEAGQRVVLVGLDPSVRGSGAADALLTGFGAWARRTGATRADLVVEAGNVAARRCYERNGWLPEGHDAGPAGETSVRYQLVL